MRKADKNGNLICLITYKHIQSCEYAISLFNGIKLFDKELKVKPSDSSSAIKQENQNSSRYAQASSNNNSRAYNNNRLSIDNHYQPKMLSQPTTPQSLMPPPQFQAHLLAQAFSSLSPSFGDFGNYQQHQLNRSWSGNLNDNDYNSSSRRNSSNFDFNNRGSNNSRRSNDFRSNNEYSRDQSNNKQGYHHDQSRSRDRRSNNNYQNKDRSRSRSPLDNNNRKRNRR